MLLKNIFMTECLVFEQKDLYICSELLTFKLVSRQSFTQKLENYAFNKSILVIMESIIVILTVNFKVKGVWLII